MFVSFSHRFLPFASNAGIFEGLFIPARAVERGLRSRAATGLAGLNAGRHKRVILDRAIMTRVIKGFAVGWDDRWRRTVWAQREHIYWFKISDGSCIRLWPEHRNHVWSYDFVADRTHDGRKYRML